MLQPFPTILILVLGTMALLGILLIKIGLYSRRRGGERRCRRCNYVVDNISSERCPECGSILGARGTVIGQRQRHLLTWLAGVLLLMLAVTYGGMEFYRRVDWYHYKPAPWVMKDLEARDGTTEERAWWELMRRKRAGSLSNYWEEKLADVAQRHFWVWASLPETKRWNAPSRRRAMQSIGFLWDQYEAGRLAPEQTEQFFRHLTTTEWTVRPIVLVGQDVPYWMNGERWLPQDTWWMKYGLAGEPGSGLVAYGGGLSGLPLGSGHTAKGSARKTAGDYEIEIPYFIEYHRGKPGSYEETRIAKPVWRGEFVHRAKIKVLEKTSDEYLKIVEAPEFADAIQKSLIIDEFGFRGAHDYFGLTVRSQAPPINLAFEVFGLVDGKEYRIGDMTFRKGSGGGWGSGMAGEHFVTRLKPKKMDLIFRSKPELAANPIDFFEVWKGNDIVFKDVPIANPKQ